MITLALLCSCSARVVVTVLFGSIQAYRVDDLWPSGKELVDFKLTNLPIRTLFHLSLGQDAQMLVLGKRSAAGALIQLCKGIRPVGSAGDVGRQCSYHLLHCWHPDLIWTYPYQRYAIVLNLQGISSLNQEIGCVVTGFLDVPPDL